MKVVGLGEAMLRLSPSGVQTLGQTPTLDVRVGGAELNVLVALAAQGHDARWLTRLGDNPLGRRISAEAHAAAVQPVVDWAPQARTPLYFVEHGAAPRPTRVHYDRGSSAMTELEPESFAWERELDGADLAVASGITSALGSGSPAAVTEFLAAAQRAGAHTALDVNYRATLWSWQDCLRIVRPQLLHADTLFASRYDLAGLLDPCGTVSGEDDTPALARALMRNCAVRTVVVRTNLYGQPGTVEVETTVVTESETGRGRAGPAAVIDAFGAGDAGMAACLHTMLTGAPLDEVAELTARASAVHHTVVGDFWQLGAISELGDGSSRIQR